MKRAQPRRLTANPRARAGTCNAEVARAPTKFSYRGCGPAPRIGSSPIDRCPGRWSHDDIPACQPPSYGRCSAAGPIRPTVPRPSRSSRSWRGAYRHPHDHISEGVMRIVKRRMDVVALIIASMAFSWRRRQRHRVGAAGCPRRERDPARIHRAHAQEWLDRWSLWTRLPAVTKDRAGIVHLKGAMNTAGTNTNAFTLPLAFRPLGGVVYVTVDLCNANKGRPSSTPPAKCMCKPKRPYTGPVLHIAGRRRSRSKEPERIVLTPPRAGGGPRGRRQLYVA